VRTWGLLLVTAVGCGRLDFNEVAAGIAPDGGGPGSDVGGSSTIALVQDDVSQLYNAATDATISFVTAPQPGDFVWVSIATAEISSLTGVTDNQGNSYAEVFSVPDPACGEIGIWGFFAANVSSTGTFTITAHGSRTWGIHLREYSGARVLDQTSTAMGSGALGDSGPVTVTQPSSLLIATQTHCDMLTTGGGAGWTNYVDSTEDQAFQAFSTEDLIDPPLGTYNGTFTFTPPDSMSWDVGVATFTL
jgi:hypothetical protein